MNASFVIVNYNRKDELLITIQKTKDLISTYKDTYEIVIVDNGSTDGSAEAVAAAHPDVNLIAQKVNTGAPAWNAGFAAAQGDYFIIMDDDSHIQSGLDEALHYMEARPQIGVLALNVLTGPYTSKDWNMQEDRNIVGFIGCGAILRRETYNKIGGYPDWIFLYVNEWDVGMRCLAAGYTVQFFENCKVIHRTSALHRTNKRLTTLVNKHGMGIVYKYFGHKKTKYLLRHALNNIKQALKQFKFKEAWYVILGVREFLKFRKSIPLVPVSAEVQRQFIREFHPVKESPFEFIRKRVYKDKDRL